MSFGYGWEEHVKRDEVPWPMYNEPALTHWGTTPAEFASLEEKQHLAKPLLKQSMDFNRALAVLAGDS